jgi:hypothetical protein
MLLRKMSGFCVKCQAIALLDKKDGVKKVNIFFDILTGGIS